MDNRDDINNLNEDDTLYFGEDRQYEQSGQQPYTEEEMFENYRPMANTNSVEYDENDYESNYTGEEEESSDNRKRLIFAYIFALVFIAIIVLVAILNLK